MSFLELGEKTANAMKSFLMLFKKAFFGTFYETPADMFMNAGVGSVFENDSIWTKIKALFTRTVAIT